MKERIHRGTQQDCWGLIHIQHLCRHHRLWKSKHSTWFCRWSENPRLKPAVFVSRSLYPPGEWGATKSFIPLAFTLSSMSRELTNIDWQLVRFWFWCAFIYFFFFPVFSWLSVLNYHFFILCFSYVSCSVIQLYGCSSRHTLQSRHGGLVYKLNYLVWFGYFFSNSSGISVCNIKINAGMLIIFVHGKALPLFLSLSQLKFFISLF